MGSNPAKRAIFRHKMRPPGGPGAFSFAFCSHFARVTDAATIGIRLLTRVIKGTMITTAASLESKDLGWPITTSSIA